MKKYAVLKSDKAQTWSAIAGYIKLPSNNMGSNLNAAMLELFGANRTSVNGSIVHFENHEFVYAVDIY